MEQMDEYEILILNKDLKKKYYWLKIKEFWKLKA